MLGMAGHAQMARAEAQAYFMSSVNGVFGGAVVPVPGGILLRDDSGVVIGAVGITGDTSWPFSTSDSAHAPLLVHLGARGASKHRTLSTDTL